MMNSVVRGGLTTALLAAACVGDAPLAGTAEAQYRRSYDRYGRDFRLHGNGFDRGKSAIYSGRRDHGYRNVNIYGASPFLYTPFVGSPFPYSASFVSSGFFGGSVQPQFPYAIAPSVGFSSTHIGTSFFGAGTVVPSPVVAAPVVTTFPSPAIYETPPITETPVEYHVAESKADAQRLRQMLRDADPEQPQLTARPLAFRESTPEDQLKSVREEQAGDQDFQSGRYLLAYTHYKNAIDKAEDRPEPRAKLFVTYATIGQYQRAVDALKTLLELDPEYPQHFIPLDSIFGEKQITKESVKTTTAQWTAKHVANPERLLLLAALMYFDGDINRSQQLFEKVALYEDLAPLIQGFNVVGEAVAVAKPNVVEPQQADLPELDIPDEEVDLVLPPPPPQPQP